MKNNLLLFLLLSLQIEISMAQITAGEVPNGTSVQNPNINLSLVVYGDTTSSVDLDCDSMADMTVLLIKGPTIIDGANYVYLSIQNPSFEICADTGTGSIRKIKYYNAGDTLNCLSEHIWATDTFYRLGDYGCMLCFGPESVTNMYFAYKKGTQIGWAKVTFNLHDGGSQSFPITLSVSEILTLCSASASRELSAVFFINISPNPATTRITLQLPPQFEQARTIEVFDRIGQLVLRMDYSAEVDVIALPAGLYFLVVDNEDGKRVTGKFIKD